MIEKVRIHEIAKELGIASKDVLDKAKKIGLNVKSAQSVVTMEHAETIANYIMNGKDDTPKQKETYQSKSIQDRRIKFSQIFKETGFNKKAIIAKAQKLGIKISQKTKSIPESDYKKIINYVEISAEDIAKVHGLPLKKIIDYATILGIDMKDSQNTITTEESKIITNYIFANIKKINENSEEELEEKIQFSSDAISYKFDYKNILLKGVPGTGKSRIFEEIIKHKLNIKNEKNLLRINIHSSSSNSDLMQGIGINSNAGKIEYKEKQGLILNFIQKATFTPLEPFALVLEEIQENSLNELIGDLIYLIEDNKRAKGIIPNGKNYTYDELIEVIMQKNNETSSIKMPNLVDDKKSYKRMLLPDNLYIFCTSNYRDDKKVIEDNLLRRFDVIEIYPKYKSELKDKFKNLNVSNFLESLNTSIVEVCTQNGEIHPDRFMIGHSIWLEVNNKISFNKAFLKVITEFKDIKDFHFEDFKNIIKNLDFPFDTKDNYTNYQEWIKDLQEDCYDFLDL